MRDLSQSHWSVGFPSSVVAAEDAAGRGAAGGFPPAAAAERDDPLVAPLFFPMVEAVELSSLRGEEGGLLCSL